MNLERTLIIAPHPDDDVIAAGGLIQRVLGTGGQIHIVFVTDGENNIWPQRWVHKKWSITTEDRAAWGALRRDEAHGSLNRLGLPSSSATSFLAFPDRGIPALIRRGDMRLLHDLRRIVREFNPTLIVSPSAQDLHSDHRAIAWCAHIAAAGETPITTYVIHGDADKSRLAHRIELTDFEQLCKRAAIECHQTQLMLSRERFLQHVRPTESFYLPEYELIAIPSALQEKLAGLRHALQVVFGGSSAPEPSGVQPATDVQDRPGEA